MTIGGALLVLGVIVTLLVNFTIGVILMAGGIAFMLLGD